MVFKRVRKLPGLANLCFGDKHSHWQCSSVLLSILDLRTNSTTVHQNKHEVAHDKVCVMSCPEMVYVVVSCIFNFFYSTN